jgi:predicted solute-binding protein
MVKEKIKMKDIEITKKTTAELLGRLFIDEAIITSTQLNIIKNELEKPTHDYGASNTVWELMNYQTYALKECAPSTWMERVSKTHKFYVNEFSIA